MDLDRRTYTYNRNGNRLSKEDLARKALSEAYTYDKLNRLTDMDKANRMTTGERRCQEYDPAGPRPRSRCRGSGR